MGDFLPAECCTLVFWSSFSNFFNVVGYLHILVVWLLSMVKKRCLIKLKE